MTLSAVVMAGLLCHPTCPLAFSTEAQVADTIVTLGDVADLGPLPVGLRQRASAVPVAQVQAGQQRLSSRDMAVRARRQMPALARWLPLDVTQDVRITAELPLPETPALRPRAKPVVPEIRAGDPLTVSIRVGPVEVQRDVEALQDARAGQQLFVRTQSGTVLTARAADGR